MRATVLLAILLGLTAATMPAAEVFARSKPVAASTDTSFDKLGQGADTVVLQDSAGNSLSWNSLNGKPRILFFGFTHCPVVCPVTVWELDAALSEIGARADDVKIDFVTLDPKRDTATDMAKYFSGFKGRVLPLTGAEAEIARLAKAYEIKFQKVNTGKGEYTLDHTAMAFLIKPDGKVMDTLAFGTTRELSVTRIKALLGIPPKN